MSGFEKKYKSVWWKEDGLLTNGVRLNGQAYTKNKCHLKSHTLQKLTQNGSWIYIEI